MRKPVDDFLLVQKTSEYIEQKSTEIFLNIGVEPCPIFLVQGEDMVSKRNCCDAEYVRNWFTQGIFDTGMDFINLSMNHIPLYDPYYIDRVITHEILHKKQVDNGEFPGHTEKFYNDLASLGFKYKSYEHFKQVYDGDCRR
jgi:hypothetical protein